MTRKPEKSLVFGWVVAAAVGVLILVFGALTFTNARQTSDTLEDAAALHTADMTLAAQDVAMKSVGQLVLSTQYQELGVAAPEAVAAATTEAERSIVEVGARFSTFDDKTSDRLTPAFRGWEQVASTVVVLAADGDATAATEQLVESLAPAAAQFASELIEERDARAAAVVDAEGRIGRLAQIAGLFTVFLLPFGAIVAYRISANRQLSVAEAQFDARLEAEKSLGRAKDEFVANVSQELRIPLASIYGFSEALLADGFVDSVAAGGLVSLINSESAGLARFAEDLLVAAHDVDAPLPMESAAVAMADELEAVIAPFRRRGHAIGGTYGPGVVLGDHVRIRQILGNLIANAVQHGGETIRVYGDVAGNNYVASVEDDGPGVAEEVEDRLFSRFVHEAPTSSASVGLGLAAAHQLAEAMNGTLEYDGTPKRTSFVLSLPLTQDAAAGAGVDDLVAASSL